MAIEINQLHPLFAAELSGVDCAHPDPELVQLVEDLMREYAVLCIRGQAHIDDEQHLAFARKFGPLELPGNKPHNGGRVAFGLYDVSNLAPDGSIIDPDSPRAKISKGNELFHADSSFNDLPSKWSMLRGVIVTPEGGATETIDMRAVWDALPQQMKDRLDGLTARHNYFHSRRKAGAKIDESDNPLAPHMRAEHPVVRISASGRKALFVGAHTQEIVGMDPAESQALIEDDRLRHSAVFRLRPSLARGRHPHLGQPLHAPPRHRVRLPAVQARHAPGDDQRGGRRPQCDPRGAQPGDAERSGEGGPAPDRELTC